MTREQRILNLATEIYCKLPFWKKWQLCKWVQSNGWDVKYISDKCYEEAKIVIDQLIRCERK
jgi:hypothetical protein